MTLKKSVKKILDDSPDIFPDGIRVVGNTVEVKRSYFYRFGNTAEDWAGKVEKELKENGLPNVYVSSRDDWRASPKTSYFVAIVEEK